MSHCKTTKIVSINNALAEGVLQNHMVKGKGVDLAR